MRQLWPAAGRGRAGSAPVPGPVPETLGEPPAAATAGAAAARGLERVTSLRTFEALASRPFRWFFVSMLSQFSSMHMQMVVNPWLVYQLTESYTMLGAIALASAVPGLLLGFPGGVIADRASKKLLVQAGQAINAASTAVVAVLVLTDLIAIEHLLVMAGIQGGVFAVMGPARQALIPEIVGPARLTNAVALNMAGLNVTRLGVPALGGFLIAWIGAGGVYLLMATLVFIAMVGLIPVTRYEGEDARVVEPSRWDGFGVEMRRVFREVGEGLAYMRRDATIFAVLAVNFFIVLMSMPYMQMMAGFVEQVLHAGPESLGLLWSVTGIGSLVGSLAIASMPNRGRGKAFLLSALLLGIALLAFAASTWLWLTAAIMVVVGLGQAGRMSLSNILLMAYTKPELQGRVMSVYMMEFSLVSFGTFLVGVLAEVVGVQWAIGGTAASLVVIAVAGLLWVPRVRDLP